MAEAAAPSLNSRPFPHHQHEGYASISDFVPPASVPAQSNHKDISPNQTPKSTYPIARPSVAADTNGRVLNPRSCVTCRKRKVKCDKLHPCSNCTRAHIDCIFPTPGRAPRRVRKSADGRDAELLARLRRLEGVVKGLGVDVPPDTVPPVPEIPREAAFDFIADGPRKDWSYDEEAEVQPDSHSRSATTMRTPLDENESKHGKLENRFGRLVVHEGRSRYVNNSFWANLSNEVEDLKGILNSDSDDDAEHASPTSQQHPLTHSQGWVFSFSSQNVDLLSLHPIPMQIETYWNIYKDRVDPLVKVLHIPSIEPTVLTAASHLANLSKSFEALLFAIYYGATTSLTPEDCRTKLGEERSVLLARYRFALEQALARANFLTTEEIVVLQAFVVFLICLRRNEDARVIWTLTGLVVRISQTMGIHRDGSHFSLAPFEVEMRRRLWWAVCILDIRASEDHGCDPTIMEQSFDTKMPLNINDADMDPAMKLFPAERRGCTDMTFCLIRFEVANTFRRLNYVPPGPPKPAGDVLAAASLQEKERWITDCHKRLEDRYLKNCDMTVPIYWVTATVARLMMSKMWLMVYHPFQRQNGGADLPEEIKDKLFITGLENIEYSNLLETECRTMKWGWLFRTYMQWHALAFILIELCHRTRGELVQRAWSAVDNTADGRWKLPTEHAYAGRNGQLWRPLMRLLLKARAARNAALHEDAAEARRESQLQSQSSSSAADVAPVGSIARYLDNAKSHPTRAPLSQAQIARFMTPPVYGTRPIDSTALMQSPRLEQTVLVDDPMDTSALLPELLHHRESPSVADSSNLQRGQSLHTQLSASNYTLDLDHAMGNSGAHHGAQASWGGPPPLPRSGTRSGTAAASDSTAVNRGFSISALAASNGVAPNQSYDPFDAQQHMSSSNLSPFENGELDWDNWDQLVRQFGMHVDDQEVMDATYVGGVGTGVNNGNGGGSEGANGGMAHLPAAGMGRTGTNWGSMGPGMGMGMGMGSGDWF